MKKLLLFLLLSVSFNFLNAQDVIYTMTGKINNQATSIDSILVENMSNNTSMLFKDLPDLPDYNINLTQKAFWGATGIKTFGKNKDFVVAGNYPGLLRLAYDANPSSPVSISVYNMQGQKVYSLNNQMLSKGNVLNIHIGRSGFYLIKVESELGVQTFKATGSSRQKNRSITATITGHPVSVFNFKSAEAISDYDFSFTLGDSIRFSAFKQGYYTYPLVLKVSGSGSANFAFNKSTADSTGISDVYVNLNDTASNTSVTNYDTLNGDVQIKYSGDKPDIKAGDIVTVDMDTIGYLRKVVSSVDKDSTITITTAPAYLNDVFVNKDVKLNTQLMAPKTSLKSTSTYKDIASALTDENGYIHPVEIIYHDKQGRLKTINLLKNTGLKAGKVNIIDFYKDLATDLYGKDGDNVHFYIKEGHVSLTSDAVFELDYKDAGALSEDTKMKKGSLKSFTFYLNSQADFLAKVALDLKKEFEKENVKRLTKIPKVTAKFVVPPGIPVWITFHVDLYGRYYFKSDANLSAEWGFESKQTLKVGGTYTKATHNFDPISEYTPENTVFPLNITGEVNDTASLEIYPRIDILFYSVVGPYAEIVPYVAGNYHAKWQSEITANGSQNFLAWNSGIDVGLNLRAGVELTFAGLYKKEFGPRTINCFDKLLWSSPKNLKLLTTIPSNITKGESINLTYQVSDLLGNPVLACPVYLNGDGSFGKQFILTDKNGEVTVTWTTDNTGSNTIKATIYNAKKGIIDQETSDVTVNNPTPVADFSATPTSGEAPLTVTFTDKSTGNPTSWQWDFGDGSTSTDQNPSYEYQNAGTYTVKLTVSNANGSNTLTKQDYITVNNNGGGTTNNIIFSEDFESDTLNSLITINKTGTFNSEPGIINRTEFGSSYCFGFGKSTCGANCFGNFATDMIIRFANKTYVGAISFDVMELDGDWGSSGYVYIDGVKVDNTYLGSTPSNDGVPDSIPRKITITIDSTISEIKFHVEDITNESEIFIDNLVITGNNPQDASFTASPTSGTAPLTVNFTDQSTNSPTSWQWDFGDGNTSTEQNPSHTYHNAGTYTVKLTVSNDQGSDTETKTDYITVRTTGTFTDPRDGQTYKTVKIGTQTWFAQNLNYKTDNSWWNDNSKENGDVYGRSYTWDAAKTACPEGWHLPSDEEWKTLEMALGMSQSEADGIGWRGTDEGGKMKETGTTHWYSPNTGATNTSGFTALPGGARSSSGSFSNLGYYGYWWSSSEGSGINAWFRFLYFENGQVDRNCYSKANGFSVRCLKD